MSERTSEWPSGLRVDFIVILPIACVGDGGGKEAVAAGGSDGGRSEEAVGGGGGVKGRSGN